MAPLGRNPLGRSRRGIRRPRLIPIKGSGGVGRRLGGMNPPASCHGCAGCAGATCAPLPPAPRNARDERLDRLFLHPRWGFVGAFLVFAAVLFVVLQVSAWIDANTTARLAEAFAGWQPQSVEGVVGRAVLDGLIGLVGIVVPYMIPLVM